MKRKEEIKFLDNEWKNMNFHLKNFLSTGNQEELHQFRVQIKKLKAMLSLIEDTSEQAGLLRGFKPVRQIFKYAGHIREAHTNLQLSARYALNNQAFENSQQKLIEEGVAEFRNNGKRFIKNIKSVHKELKRQLPEIDDKSVAAYYKRQLQQIAANLVVSGFTEDMHTNRKLIKILVYNYKLAGKALKTPLPLNRKYLDKLQEAIGKWHDNVVAEQLFSSPELNDQPVVMKIKRKNAGVKRSIKALADDFMKKATAVEDVAGS